MKKIALGFSLILSICILESNAQQSMFKKGDAVINATVGFGSVLFSGYGYTTTLPPVAASLEYGVLDRVFDKGTVGIGGYLGYSSYKYEWYGSGSNYNNIIICARAALHYPFIAKLDTYTGLMLGLNLRTHSEFGSTPIGYSPSGSGPAWMWFIGGRYYFNKQFAALAEIGYGIAWVNLGIAFKL